MVTAEELRSLLPDGGLVKVDRKKTVILAHQVELEPRPDDDKAGIWFNVSNLLSELRHNQYAKNFSHTMRNKNSLTSTSYPDVAVDKENIYKKRASGTRAIHDKPETHPNDEMG